MQGKAGQGQEADISKINSTEFVGSDSEKSDPNNSINIYIVNSWPQGGMWTIKGIGLPGIEKGGTEEYDFIVTKRIQMTRVLSLKLTFSLTNPLPSDTLQILRRAVMIH